MFTLSITSKATGDVSTYDYQDFSDAILAALSILELDQFDRGYLYGVLDHGASSYFEHTVASFDGQDLYSVEVAPS